MPQMIQPKQLTQLTINVTDEELAMIDNLLLDNPLIYTGFDSRRCRKSSRSARVRSYLLAQAAFNATALMTEEGHLEAPLMN